MPVGVSSQTSNDVCRAAFGIHAAFIARRSSITRYRFQGLKCCVCIDSACALVEPQNPVLAFSELIVHLPSDLPQEVLAPEIRV